MSVKLKKAGRVELPPVLGEFRPMCALWEGNSALYPSEQSARWHVRRLRPDLAAAQAVAIHRGRLLIHPARFAEVVEKEAIRSFEERARRDIGHGEG